MKKIFTLIAVAAMALTANAADPTPAVTYTFDNQASTYVVGENCVATTYTMDDIPGFSVNYTGASSAKMSVKLAANEDIFFSYGNSSTANNVIKSAPGFVVFDKKNFIINIPVQNGDVVKIKYSAKGSNAAKMTIDGSEPPVTMDEGSVTECSSKTDAVVFSATATKGGTAKFKETNGGMRLYAISINEDVPTAVAGIAEAKAESKAPVKVITANGVQIGNYNVAGQQVK